MDHRSSEDHEETRPSISDPLNAACDIEVFEQGSMGCGSVRSLKSNTSRNIIGCIDPEEPVHRNAYGWPGENVESNHKVLSLTFRCSAGITHTMKSVGREGYRFLLCL